MVQLIVLVLVGQVGDGLGLGVFLLPILRLLHHGYGLAIALAAGEDDASLVLEELRIPGEVVLDVLHGEKPEKALDEIRPLHPHIVPSLRPVSLGTIDNEVQHQGDTDQANDKDCGNDDELENSPEHTKKRLDHIS